jgi:hypothetical protein
MRCGPRSQLAAASIERHHSRHQSSLLTAAAQPTSPANVEETPLKIRFAALTTCCPRARLPPSSALTALVPGRHLRQELCVCGVRSSRAGATLEHDP